MVASTFGVSLGLQQSVLGVRQNRVTDWTTKDAVTNIRQGDNTVVRIELTTKEKTKACKGIRTY